MFSFTSTAERDGEAVSTGGPPGFHVTYFMDTTHWSVGRGVNVVYCYQLVGVVSLTCVGSDRWGCGDSGDSGRR